VIFTGKNTYNLFTLDTIVAGSFKTWLIASPMLLSTLFSFLLLAGIDLSGHSALTVVGPTNDAFGLIDPPAEMLVFCRLPTAAEVDILATKRSAAQD
jgi:hypothetical protein